MAFNHISIGHFDHSYGDRCPLWTVVYYLLSQAFTIVVVNKNGECPFICFACGIFF